MAQTNITPVYGLWLKENLALYQFHSADAQNLSKELNELDISKTESNQKLIELYTKFVDMLCNSMHSLAFGVNDKEITTKYLKAYLVENEYGVMTPIAFMEEHRKQAVYNIEGSASSVVQEVKKIDMEVWDFYVTNKDAINSCKEFPDKKKPILFIACFSLLLLIACYLGLILNYHNIVSDIHSNQLIYLWAAIAVLTLIFTYKVIREMCLVFRWKYYKVNKQWLEKKLKEIEDNTGSTPSLIADYSGKITEAMEKNLQELPQPMLTIPKYKEESNKRISSIVKMAQKYGKSGKGLLFFGPLIMIFMCAFLFYVTKQYDYRALLNEGISYFTKESKEPENVPDTTETEQKDVLQKAVLKKISVKSSKATSSLTGKSSGIKYTSKYTIDGKLDTCWQEGEKGDGLGESITYKFDGSHSLSKIKIWNGRSESKDKFIENNRIKELEIICYKSKEEVFKKTLTISDKYTTKGITQSLADDDKLIDCDQVKIKIVSVYSGSKYDDTCLTDIKFYEAVINKEGVE